MVHKKRAAPNWERLSPGGQPLMRVSTSSVSTGAQPTQGVYRVHLPVALSTHREVPSGVRTAHLLPRMTRVTEVERAMSRRSLVFMGGSFRLGWMGWSCAPTIWTPTFPHDHVGASSRPTVGSR